MTLTYLFTRDPLIEVSEEGIVVCLLMSVKLLLSSSFVGLIFPW